MLDNVMFFKESRGSQFTAQLLTFCSERLQFYRSRICTTALRFNIHLFGKLICKVGYIAYAIWEKIRKKRRRTFFNAKLHRKCNWKEAHGKENKMRREAGGRAKTSTRGTNDFFIDARLYLNIIHIYALKNINDKHVFTLFICTHKLPTTREKVIFLFLRFYETRARQLNFSKSRPPCISRNKWMLSRGILQQKKN